MNDAATKQTDLLIQAVRVGLAEDVSTLSLEDALYEHWYSRPGREVESAPLDVGPQRLVACLRAADARWGRFEAGWTARRVTSHGRVLASRADETLLCDVGAYVVPDQPGTRPDVGMSIEVSMARGGYVDGYWVVQGGRSIPEDATLARYYLNVGPRHAPALVRAITDGLRPGVDYTLKVPGEPSGFARTDVAVLYLPEASAPDWHQAVGACVEQLPLRDDIPPLTYRLARGVAFAEAALGGASFGEQRCTAIAKGIQHAVDAANAGVEDPGSVLPFVENALREAGIDPARPWATADRLAALTWVQPWEAQP